MLAPDNAWRGAPRRDRSARQDASRVGRCRWMAASRSDACWPENAAMRQVVSKEDRPPTYLMAPQRMLYWCMASAPVMCCQGKEIVGNVVMGILRLGSAWIAALYPSLL